MGLACVPIRGQSRMRAYPWTVAHACLSVDSRACVSGWFSRPTLL